MILGLGLGEMVNAASGALFFLTGVAVFAFARRGSPIRLLGLTLALYGAGYPVDYVGTGGSITARALGAVLSAGFLAGAIALAWRYPERADRKRSFQLGAILALALLWGAFGLRNRGDWNELLLGDPGPPLDALFTHVALAFLPAAFALRAIGRPEEAPRLARLTLVFALYAAFHAARLFAWLADPGFPIFYLVGVNLLPAGLWLVAGATTGLARLGRNTALAIAAAALLGALVTTILGSDETSQLGIPGALRTLCWGVLALAILGHDLLERPLPRLAVSRGPAAATALAALFIVAQVAQEFLAAEYGLLMGGIVAGALLFAANPIQRALETRRAATSAAAPTDPPPGSAREAAYRKALRIALRDRALSPEEETHLHELAEQLGIGAGRAHALFVEVKREVET